MSKDSKEGLNEMFFWNRLKRILPNANTRQRIFLELWRERQGIFLFCGDRTKNTILAADKVGFL